MATAKLFARWNRANIGRDNGGGSVSIPGAQRGEGARERQYDSLKPYFNLSSTISI